MGMEWENHNIVTKDGCEIRFIRWIGKSKALCEIIMESGNIMAIYSREGHILLYIVR
jgi:hypothetical protein